MPSLTPVHTPALEALDEATFAGLGCTDHGIVVLKGATSWGAHDRGYIEVPTHTGTLMVPLAYDEREAPFAVDADGNERDDLLLSLTDEDDYLACAWACVGAGSPLVGLGIDLSAGAHFAERPATSKRRDLSLLLFTPEERTLIPALGDDELIAKATLFAAKEAAFKSCAHPLRTWYHTQSQQLLFEVRHFVMAEPGLERGTGRNRAAQDAMDLMGIERIAIWSAEVCGMALVTATALLPR